MNFRFKSLFIAFSAALSSAFISLPAQALPFTQQGTAVVSTAERHNVQVATQRRRVPERFDRRVVHFKTRYRPGTIIVDTRNKYLYHVLGKGKAWRYGVGVGKAGFNWSGHVTIRRKAKWPGWTPPARMRAREAKKGRILPRYMPGGVENPLGARALYLYRGGKDTLYRIHGTNNPSSIGLNVSSGCIRLRNADVAHLYDRVRVGARVIVR